MHVPELICALSASLFVFTGCWVGYVIALNGVVAHFAKAVNHSTAYFLVAYDVACNASLVVYVLVTTTWMPWSLFICALGMLGFAFSFRFHRDLPYTSAFVHCTFVMGCGLVNVGVWCSCCLENAAEALVTRLNDTLVFFDAPMDAFYGHSASL
jgi:hypothetical protein